MEIAKLFARIGIKTDLKQGQDFLSQLKGMKIGLGIAAISATAFIAILKKITNEAFASSLALKKFNLETGANVEELQRWQAVANEVSGSGQAIAESIKAITANQEKIKLGQGNISGYAMLGINPNQDPFKILEDLRVKTRGLSQAMKKNILEQMGVSRDLIGTLELTNDEFERMRQSAFVLPQNILNNIDKARGSTQKLSNAITYLKGYIVSGLTPSIIKVNNELMKWIKNNKEGLVKNIKMGFDWITKFVRGIFNTIKAFNAIIKATIGWKIALGLLLGALVFFNRALLFSPIGLITAGIILLILLVDDLYTALNDPSVDSVFGRLFETYPELKKKFLDLIDILKDVSKFMNLVFTGKYDDIDTLIDKYGMVAVYLLQIVQSFQLAFDTIGAILKTFGSLGELLFVDKDKGLKDLMDTWSKWKESLSKKGAGLGEAFLQAQGGLGQVELGTGYQEWLSKQNTKNNTINNNTTENNIKVDVNANVQDGTDLGKKVKQEIQRSWDKTSSEKNPKGMINQ
jgi:hypothetical protein